VVLELDPKPATVDTTTLDASVEPEDEVIVEPATGDTAVHVEVPVTPTKTSPSSHRTPPTSTTKKPPNRNGTPPVPAGRERPTRNAIINPFKKKEITK
jgi:hypothetical protein